jgi:two-component system response regulator RegA
MTGDQLLMLVEDDADFARTLKRSLERRNYEVLLASTPEALVEILASRTPRYAVVDLKLGNSSGLSCVDTLHRHDPTTRIVVLTGFASIATAVEAIKLGACYYLAKPANTDDIEEAFAKATGNVAAPLSRQPTSIKQLEWERIHEVLVETGFNISQTARRLGMHRRTLVRKLEKRHLK